MDEEEDIMGGNSFKVFCYEGEQTNEVVAGGARVVKGNAAVLFTIGDSE